MSFDWFESGHAEGILASLTAAIPTGKDKRRAQQNFMAFTLYGTQQWWDNFLDPTVPTENKMHSLFSLVSNLGLRLPTEHSLKYMCSAWVVATHSTDELAKMDPVTKSVFLQKTKSAFESYRRKLPIPSQWIDVLPEVTAKYFADFPIQASIAFQPGTMPIAPAIDRQALWAYDMSYGCRGGTSKKAQPMQLVLSPHGTSSASAAPAGFEAAAASWMNRMENMFSAFARGVMPMMEHASLQSMGSAPALTGLRHQRSFAALAAPPPLLALQASPSGQHEPQPLLPPPGTPYRALSVASPSEAPTTEAEAPTTPTKEDMANGQGAAADMLDMTKMLDSRSMAKKIEKDNAKKDGDLSTNKHTLKQKNAKAATKASAKVSSKGKTPATTAAKVASKTSGKGKKPATAPTAEKFGCSKCRWSEKGCARCRAK
jgi:hypothetical protein